MASAPVCLLSRGGQFLSSKSLDVREQRHSDRGATKAEEIDDSGYSSHQTEVLTGVSRAAAGKTDLTGKKQMGPAK